MSNKLWQVTNGIHRNVEKYTVGNDHVLDIELLPYDIAASRAHATMLKKIGVLSPTELKKIKSGLNDLSVLVRNGDFIISQSQEDGHTAIEQFLTEQYGEVGKKIHTARSRNDQVLVAMRLYMLDALRKIERLISELSSSYMRKQEMHHSTPMPGYTHMQKAMPSTVGKWLGCYASAFDDTQLGLRASISLLNQNPLGSAAGFGVEGIEIDRLSMTEDLGFEKTQENEMYCGISRGYFELSVLNTINMIQILCSKFANDMLLFTTQEFDYFSLPNEYTTGSSIMPNKANYDVFEIMRGSSSVLNSYVQQVQGIVVQCGTGYQRDLSLTKEPLMKGVRLTIETLELLIDIVPHMEVNVEALEAAMTDDLYATEKVYSLVSEGTTFRDAYVKVKLSL